jgi:anti-sigma B factor antagonist
MILETTQLGGLLQAKINQREANLKNADQFKQEMFALIDGGHPVLALNFEEVTYVDSSFLGALVSSLKYALSKKGDIYLTNLKKDIHDLLALIRMDKVFKIYSTVAEVVDKVK